MENNAILDRVMHKFQYGLNVVNLDRAVEFYRLLFDVNPVRSESGYAEFELSDPPLVLALSEGPQQTGGALNHVGFRVPDSAALVAIQLRLEAGGIRTQREEGVECCYARQTKFWVPDVDGNLWEIYVFEEDLEHSGFGGELSAATPERTVNAVLYKGPLRQLVDNDGRVFPRGRRVTIPAHVVEPLRQGGLAASFVFFS